MPNKSQLKTIKKLIISFIIIVIGVILFFIIKESIDSKNKLNKDVEFYYIESSSSLLKPEKRQFVGESNADILSLVLAAMKESPKTEGFVKAIPDTIQFNKANIDKGIVTLDVSSDYNQMKAGEEVICRSAIVWTLTSLDFVDHIRITVDGQELVKNNKEPIGLMNRENVVINPIVSPEPKKYKTVKLYFSNEDATALETEERQIEVSPNQPEEKGIMEQLIIGPKKQGLNATVPSETKIRDITTTEDGICYVDLSSEFVTKHSGGATAEMLTIYSIVDSLTELENVKKVQFLIEGEKQEEYKGHMDFSKPFEARQIHKKK